MATKGKIAVVGCGLIGRSWAMLFASGGYNVMIYDKDETASLDALTTIKEELHKLESLTLLRGELSAEEQVELISRAEDLETCVKDAFFVQESVPECVEMKKIIFNKLDKLATEDMILSSSTSCITPSTFTEDLKHRSHVLVAHPANPPYHVPIVEIVPSAWTNPDVVTKTVELMKEIGQKPVIVKKEIYGFAINRMQYAIINECWRLVQDGVMSVEDIDAVMSEGLGMRYAFLGPFETCQLNANGMLDYCNRYGQGIYKVSETFGPNPRMEDELAEKVHEEICKISPLEKLAERRQWRDARLTALAHMKRLLAEQDKAQ
ncbi:unnamed protein product [Larinioides sclopetarius]|uniref:L-gulonate 3-dehydrogenase n=1 Tax=Larinioides sclopetarius TaxID=280406 RepID=A0AAV2BXW1_9ARAC